MKIMIFWWRVLVRWPPTSEPGVTYAQGSSNTSQKTFEAEIFFCDIKWRILDSFLLLRKVTKMYYFSRYEWNKNHAKNIRCFERNFVNKNQINKNFAFFLKATCFLRKKYLDLFVRKLKDTLKDLWSQNSRFGDVMSQPSYS